MEICCGFFYLSQKGVKEMAEEEKSMELLSLAEAAEYLKFSKTYLYRLCREKKVPHVNYGRHLLFRKSDLYNWLGSMVCEVGA